MSQLALRTDVIAKRLDLDSIRAEFPILHQKVHNRPLIYLDNAATTQKPWAVIRTLEKYYRQDNANVHRGVHALSERATAQYEGVRDKIVRFVNANCREEIIFVKGTTEAINLVAQSYARPRLKAGDEILISTMEHHSNIVPWQLVCEQTGATLKVAPIDDNGDIILPEFEKQLNNKTKLISLCHVSNALGTINPLRQLIDMAHLHGIPVMIDGAQAVPRMPIDLKALDCDFYAFSSHKLYGPTGLGVLYGKAALLDSMPPYQAGGDMIRQVSFDHSTYNDLPYKFEAGTPNIAATIGLGAALDYVQSLGLDLIAEHEEQLLAYASTEIEHFPGVQIIGTAKHKTGILSFTMTHAHPHDISTILDMEGVAVRAGHHCAMPVMKRFKVAATARASFALYNTKADVDAFIHALTQVARLFK